MYDKKENIVYICDENYVIPTRTSINSLASQLSSIDILIDVYVICVGFIESENEIIEGIAIPPNMGMFFVYKDRIDTLNKTTHKYVSSAALYKFQIPQILYQLDKVLYVDGDVIFEKGFEEIFKYDIKDYYVAAVSDYFFEYEHNYYDEITCKSHYFNSGVMLLNLCLMRESNITQKLVEYKENDNNARFMDQDALNMILGDQWLPIPVTFNYLIVYREKFSAGHFANVTGEPEEKIIEWVNHPSILHFAGGNKIWNSPYVEFYKEWLKYVSDKDFRMIYSKKYFDYLANTIEEKSDVLHSENRELRHQIENLQRDIRYFENHTLWGVALKIYNRVRIKK